MNGKVVGYDTAAIRKMYGEYVLACDGIDRHTDGVREKLGTYNVFLSGAFPMNSRIQNELYERMMDCAVEFEESGFVAGFGIGFRCALGLLQGSTSPVREETTPNTSDAETTPQEDTRRPQEPETPPVNTDNAQAESDFWMPKGANTLGSVTSRDIAKMFGVTHCSVVQRIERILPKLDAESKEFFRVGTYVSPRHRMYKMYLLNKAACDLYIKEINRYSQFINVTGGLAKMRQLMKEVFPAEGNVS